MTTSSPSTSVPSAGSDVYDMNPMELIRAPSETLEEMDYEAYLAFHGMEVLEGTPPQVIAAMVADVEAAKALDARARPPRATLRREAADLAAAADGSEETEALARRLRDAEEKLAASRAIRAVPGGRRGGDRARRGVRASRG